MKSVSGIHTPIKILKHIKCTRLFLIKGEEKYDKKTSLKLFTFRTLKILWFNCFRLKKSICIVKSVLVFCIVLQCFLLLF